MAAALASMTPAGSGTLQMSLHGGNPAAYPLTMVIYAMVPTSGTSHAKAASIAHFLDFAAGAGQTPGVQPGQLPAGYLPLPATLRAQTRKIAVEVADQTGDHPAGAHPGSPAGRAAGPGASVPGSSPGQPGSAAVSRPGSQATSPGGSGSGSGTPATLVADAHPPTSALTRFALPALLILGGAAALGGTLTGAGSAQTPLATRLRRLRRRG